MVTQLPGSFGSLTSRYALQITSDPCGEFLDGIVKRPEELAVCADAVSGLIKNMSWVVSANIVRVRLFVTFFVTQEEP